MSGGRNIKEFINHKGGYMQSISSKYAEFCKSNAEWIKSGNESIGMYYGLDSAVLGVAGIDDKDLRISLDNEGFLLAEIDLSFQVKSMKSIDKLFYQIWHKVGFDFNIIVKEVLHKKVIHKFVTGNSSFGYRGEIVFFGDNVSALFDEAGVLGETS